MICENLYAVGLNCLKKYKRTLYRQVQRALLPVVDPAQTRSQLFEISWTQDSFLKVSSESDESGTNDNEEDAELHESQRVL
jgi:hypothetical protein